MGHQILLHPKAKAFLDGLDTDLRDRIRDRLLSLGEEPEMGKRLRHSEFWRLRIGDHRAIYEIDRGGKRVVVLFIGHRRDVYDDFSRLLW